MHIRLNWARRTSRGWWNEWDDTVIQTHEIRNSSPGGLRPSTLPLGHGGSPQYWFRIGRNNIWGWLDQSDETALQTQDSRFEVWGREHYLSVTEAPHNTESLRVIGEETFYETYMRGSNPRSRSCSFNHFTKAPASLLIRKYLLFVYNDGSASKIMNHR